jgi:tRNA-binding EMAP/Myf-like protein
MRADDSRSTGLPPETKQLHVNKETPSSVCRIPREHCRGAEARVSQPPLLLACWGGGGGVGRGLRKRWLWVQFALHPRLFACYAAVSAGRAQAALQVGSGAVAILLQWRRAASRSLGSGSAAEPHQSAPHQLNLIIGCSIKNLRPLLGKIMALRSCSSRVTGSRAQRSSVARSYRVAHGPSIAGAAARWQEQRLLRMAAGATGAARCMAVHGSAPQLAPSMRGARVPIGCRCHTLHAELRPWHTQDPPLARPQPPPAAPPLPIGVSTEAGAPAPGAEAAAAPAPAAPATPDAAASSPVTGLDIRIGRVTKCERHPDADSLYGKGIRGGPEAGLIQRAGRGRARRPTRHARRPAGPQPPPAHPSAPPAAAPPRQLSRWTWASPSSAPSCRGWSSLWSLRRCR